MAEKLHCCKRVQGTTAFLTKHYVHLKKACSTTTETRCPVSPGSYVCLGEVHQRINQGAYIICSKSRMHMKCQEFKIFSKMWPSTKFFHSTNSCQRPPKWVRNLADTRNSSEKRMNSVPAIKTLTVCSFTVRKRKKWELQHFCLTVTLKMMVHLMLNWKSNFINSMPFYWGGWGN